MNVPDCIVGNQAVGDVAEAMQQCRFDPGLRRPYFDHKGRPSVTIFTGNYEHRKGPDGSLITNKQGDPVQFPVYKQELIANLSARGLFNPVWNATSLRKDEWELFDRAVIRASRVPLRAWADISAANTFGGFNGMSKSALVRETMTDVGQAQVDMDGLSAGKSDSPLFTPDVLPLPITHVDFTLSSRRLMESRNTGTPLDTELAEMAGRRVAESVEQMTVGSVDYSGLVIGSSSTYTRRGIYGLITHPDRITKTDLTTPTGTNPSDVLTDVLEMRTLAEAQNFYGPYMLYYSKAYETFLDNDYYSVVTAAGVSTPTQTLRERIKRVEGIMDVRRLHYLSASGYVMVLVQMNSDTVRAVNGMDITTVQWESKGGMQINFKVMAIQVPDFRAQPVGTSQSTRKCGIVHATTS